jgi:RNA polymerase sigma factor (sigma-70 family)
MAGRPLSLVLQHVRGLAAAPDTTDAELLGRIAAGREEAAFAAVLARHGPLVFGVCRRVLGDVQDAEDAFQATFLVLARRAASIRRPASLASWLYGVASRVALDAKTRAARRRLHEWRAAARPQGEPADEAVWADVRRVLDEEVRRLPEKYRAPLVLHYLEGQTKQEAARQLGWAEGIVSGRLDRARKLLRRRLERRGVSVSAGALAVVLAEQAAPAAPPAALAEAARRAGLSSAAVTPGVASLAEGAMPSLLAARVKLTAVLLLLAGALAAPYLPASPPQKGPEVAQAAPAAAPAAPQPEEADEDAEPGLKDRAVARLEAVAPQRWAASWQADLDVNEQPAGPALGRLARELGLTVEATPAQRRALERPITLSLRGRSRLELVEEVCRRVDLYPVYPSNVTRTDLPQRVLRLKEGPRPWPVRFAGPFRVAVEDVRRKSPAGAGEMQLRFLALGLPPAVGLPLSHEKALAVKRVAGAKGQDFLDPARELGWTGTEAYTGLDVTQGVALKGLGRGVAAIGTVEGTVRVPVVSRVEVLRFQGLKPGATQKAGAVQVTLRSVTPRKYFYNGERQRDDFDFRFRNAGLFRLEFVAHDAGGKLLRTVYNNGGQVLKEEGYHVVGFWAPPATVTAKLLAEVQHLDYAFRLKDVPVPPHR